MKNDTAKSSMNFPSGILLNAPRRGLDLFGKFNKGFAYVYAIRTRAMKTIILKLFLCLASLSVIGMNHSEEEKNVKLAIEREAKEVNQFYDSCPQDPKFVAGLQEFDQREQLGICDPIQCKEYEKL